MNTEMAGKIQEVLTEDDKMRHDDVQVLLDRNM